MFKESENITEFQKCVFVNISLSCLKMLFPVSAGLFGIPWFFPSPLNTVTSVLSKQVDINLFALGPWVCISEGAEHVIFAVASLLNK